MHFTERRPLKLEKIHQFHSLSSSNSRRQLSTTKCCLILILSLQFKLPQKTKRLGNMLLFDAAIQTLPPKGLQTKKSGTTTAEFPETRTENRLVPFLDGSEKSQTETQETNNHTTAKQIGNYNPLAVKAPQIDKKVSERRRNWWIMSSTVLHKIVQTPRRITVCASGFWNWPQKRCFSWLRSRCHCNRSEWNGII